MSASFAADAVLRRFSGARATRVIDPSFAEVREHAHDWPVLSLYVMGAYRNRSALGEAWFDTPVVMLYAPGAAHANQAGPEGFEQIEVEFDPAWLGRDATIPDQPVRRGQAASTAAARALARLWSTPSCGEDVLRAATRELIGSAFTEDAEQAPAWVGQVARRVASDPGVTLRDLAAEAGRHPSWVGQAYRAVTGESVSQTATRRRVEAATRLLRETVTPAAQVALEADFCDQSHMIRAFRRTLGRTPGAVRADRILFRALKTSNPEALGRRSLRG